MRSSGMRSCAGAMDGWAMGPKRGNCGEVDDRTVLGYRFPPYPGGGVNGSHWSP